MFHLTSGGADICNTGHSSRHHDKQKEITMAFGKDKMAGLKIVKRNNTKYIADMFNPNGDRVATFYNENFLHNVLIEVFRFDLFEPIPYAEASGAPDKPKAVPRPKKPSAYVKSLVKYTIRTDLRVIADGIMKDLDDRCLYVEQIYRNKVFIMTAYPSTESEVEYLKGRDWELA
jgi:hypothetical protein